MSHENMNKCFKIFQEYSSDGTPVTLDKLDLRFMQKVQKEFTDGNHQIKDQYKELKLALNGIVIFLDNCSSGRWTNAKETFNQAKYEYETFADVLDATSKNADNLAKYYLNSVTTKISTTDIARKSTDRDKSRDARVTLYYPSGDQSSSQALRDKIQIPLKSTTGKTLPTARNAATVSNQVQSVQQTSRYINTYDSIHYKDTQKYKREHSIDKHQDDNTDKRNDKSILQEVTLVSPMKKGSSSPEYRTNRKSEDASITEPEMTQVSRATSVTPSTTYPYYDYKSKKTDIYRRSGKASISLHENNPNTVYLSDPNRPTKLAERFSELYSNEHTDTFEELVKCSQQGALGNYQEIEIVNDLLFVVQKAYAHCKKWNKKIEQKLTSEKMTKVRRSEDEYVQRRGQMQRKKELLVQENVDEVVKDFMANKIQVFCFVDVTETAENKYMKYAKSTVEIVWWMCVQDPPIHLEYATSRSFDSSLYRSYTKSGSFVDFCVWPLVRLHKNGPILAKGIAQVAFHNKGHNQSTTQVYLQDLVSSDIAIFVKENIWQHIDKLITLHQQIG